MRLDLTSAALAISLLASTAATASQVVPPETAERNKLICKKTFEVGSAVRKKKVCATQREWDDMARGARAQTERMQQKANGGY